MMTGPGDNKYVVWNPDDGGEEDGEVLLDYSPELAAERHARNRDYASGDGYSERQTIMVRCEDGVLLKFQVRAVHSVSYYSDLVS